MLTLCSHGQPQPLGPPKSAPEASLRLVKRQEKPHRRSHTSEAADAPSPKASVWADLTSQLAHAESQAFLGAASVRSSSLVFLRLRVLVLRPSRAVQQALPFPLHPRQFHLAQHDKLQWLSGTPKQHKSVEES